MTHNTGQGHWGLVPMARRGTQNSRGGSARATVIASASCGLGAFALYAATLVRGVGWDDAAELSAGIDQLGIVHQTGYPAYLLVAKAFTILEPLGSVATRTNLFSAVSAAATVWLAAAFIGRRTRDPIAAILTGALLATGSVFWSQARVASVYPAFLLAIMVLLVALRWWDEAPQPKRLAAIAAALGCVCVGHKTGFLFLPFVVTFVLSRARNTLSERRNMLALAAFLVPVVTLIYVPARWGIQGITTSGGTFTHATPLQWITGTARASDAELLVAGLSGTLRNLAHVPVLAVSQLSMAALVLIPFGLWFARRDRLFVWCALAPTVLISLLSATTSASYGYWHLPLILVGALAAGYGATAVRDSLPGRSRLTLIATLLLALAVTTGAAVGTRYAFAQNLDASEWAREALSELPQDARLRGGWTAFTALRATQMLEGLRPDVDVRIEGGPFITTPRSLRRSRGHYVASVSDEKPPNVRPERMGATARTNFKGLSGLEFYGIQLGPPELEAVMLKGVDRTGLVRRHGVGSGSAKR